MLVTLAVIGDELGEGALSVQDPYRLLGQTKMDATTAISWSILAKLNSDRDCLLPRVVPCVYWFLYVLNFFFFSFLFFKILFYF